MGYEKPAIYDSFDVLDAKLKTAKGKTRKRESADNGTVREKTANDRTLDLLPIKGKNRLEDEVILLNKREAWRRENEERLEEVAFGKDMRNGTGREWERFEKLTETDKRRPVDETGFRTKRENVVGNGRTSTTRHANLSDRSRAAFSGIDGGPPGGGRSKTRDDRRGGEPSEAIGEDKLRLAERRINVFADNNEKAGATIDAADAAKEKLALNARTDNYVKGKLGAINCETKIDNADVGGGGSFVNSTTSDTEPRVSAERRKVSAEAEKGADDNAVKLNRATNYYRAEEIEIEPEIELRNLRRARGEGIYGAADRGDSIYGDDNLSGDKLGEKYMGELDEPGDPDTGNNLELLRLRSNKRSGDVVEWKMTPVIKRSPYYYGRASSRALRLMGERGMPVSRSVEGVGIDLDAYLDNPTLWRMKRNRGGAGRYGVFDVTPMLGIIDEDDDDDDFSRFRVHSRGKRVSEVARKWSNAAQVGTYPVLMERNREFRDTPRSFRNDPEPGDRTIYGGARSRPPARPYHDVFAYPATFRLVPDILAGRGDGGAHRYPAGAYLEYGPFKERPRDSNRRVARWNRPRSGIASEGADDLPGDNNLANGSSKYGFARERKFRVETEDGAAFAKHRGDYFVSNDTIKKKKYTKRGTGENNESGKRN